MTTSPNAPQGARTYLECVQDAYVCHWAGTKDGERSRDRALAAVPVGLHEEPAEHTLRVGAARDLVVRARGFWGPATTNRHLAALSTVWRLAHQNGIALNPPPEGLYLKEPGGRTRVISEAELGALCAELPPAYGPFAVFLWETGCRVSEGLNLRPAGFDRTRRTVSFLDTKNGEDRSVPLTVRAYEILRVRDNRRPDGPDSGPFERLSQSSFNHHWATARERMGLQDDPEMVPHALRHSAISRWVLAGIPLPVVSKLAGHKSFRTTQRYVHVSANDCLTAMQKAGIL